jgi:hypothetical protein
MAQAWHLVLIESVCDLFTYRVCHLYTSQYIKFHKLQKILLIICLVCEQSNIFFEFQVYISINNLTVSK